MELAPAATIRRDPTDAETEGLGRPPVACRGPEAKEAGLTSRHQPSAHLPRTALVDTGRMTPKNSEIWDDEVHPVDDAEPARVHGRRSRSSAAPRARRARTTGTAPGDRVVVGIALRPDRGRAAAEYGAFVEPSGRDRWQPGLARLDTRDVPKYVADAVVDG
jgi:hypothetical protein